MTRYFFDVREGSELAADEIGLDLASDQAAREEAAARWATFAMLRGADWAFANRLTVEVRDDIGPVFRVKIAVH